MTVKVGQVRRYVDGNADHEVTRIDEDFVYYKYLDNFMIKSECFCPIKAGGGEEGYEAQTALVCDVPVSEPESKTRLRIVIEGNPIQGFTCFGPFDKEDIDEVARMEQFDAIGDWWVADLNPFDWGQDQPQPQPITEEDTRRMAWENTIKALASLMESEANVTDGDYLNWEDWNELTKADSSIYSLYDAYLKAHQVHPHCPTCGQATS